MPEIPDLVYIEQNLSESLPGRTITSVTINEPIVLRTLVRGTFDALLIDHRFGSLERHGPFLRFILEPPLELIIHFMLAGRFQWKPTGDKPGRGWCFTLHLDNGQNLHYLDDKKMGKVYLLPPGKTKQVPGFDHLGMDILSADFTLPVFKKLIGKRRHQVRVFLLDHTALNVIGNAYADEILFDAKIHPKTTCNQLNEAQIEQLYRSIIDVTKWGIEQVRQAQQPIEVKVRDHVKVRNRQNQPCPVCGTTIRRAGVRGYDAYFCPNCQPATRKQFISWNPQKE